ncbi:MAG: CoA transferase, partial [Hyphomicrobiales bacterium]
MADGTQTTAQGPLAGVCILDLAGELAIAGSRLLAGLGACVIRPEPASGGALSQRPPFAAGRAGQVSLANVVYNLDKQPLTVESDAAGFARIRELAGTVDAVLLSSDSPYFGAFEPSPREWAERNAHIVFVVVDPFPPRSPWGNGPFTDLTIAAASGFDWYCGDPAGTPEHPKGQLALGYTGIGAAAAVMTGIAARAYGNRPAWFELTAQEAFGFACLQSGDPNQWRWHGLVPSRKEWGATAARSLHRCKDGRWLTFVMLGAHFDDFGKWLAREGISDAFLGEEWLDRAYYLEHQHEFVEAIGELCRRNNRDDVVREGQRIGLMVMPLSSISDLLGDPHLAERKMFHEVETAAGRLRLPRAPAVFSRTPVPAPGTVRCAEAANTASEAPQTSPRLARGQPLPLAGMRVADFTWMLAAPVATRVLADMGADVIRIESHHRRDMTREIGPQPPGYFSLDTNSTQHQASSNKRSIALNLNSEQGVELAREIIARSDIVFENYTPGTMKKWGLDHEALLRERPDLIVVSQPAVGTWGPHAHWGAIGNGVAGYGGINMLTGYPENPPFGVGPIVSDLIAPMISVTATLAAVEHRRRTGEGQHVDCGMVEATLWMLDTAFAECQ